MIGERPAALSGPSTRPAWRLLQSVRLIRMADDPFTVRAVREACSRAGLGPGGRILDVGCGPLGALDVLSEVVGPSGLVAGLDASREALSVARGVLKQRGRTGVALVEADVNGEPPEELLRLAPFDAAYCRLLLCNQDDPAETVRRITRLLRPGGMLIVHELRDDPAYPQFDPPLPAARKLLDLMTRGMARRGKRPEIGGQLHALARETELRLVDLRGLMECSPTRAREFIQTNLVGMLLSFEAALLQDGLATPDEIQALADDLLQAAAAEYRAFASWIVTEAIFEVP
ncbi:MAG: class I SAM-dependent methyltransferase [Chloroflexota bacterium]